LSNGNAVITGSNTANPVSIQGVTVGQVYVTYTVGTTPCQSASTFLLEVIPLVPPTIKAGFRR
jgi:hypothetical protein